MTISLESVLENERDIKDWTPFMLDPNKEKKRMNKILITALLTLDYLSEI
jgi:hypothetical protein